MKRPQTWRRLLARLALRHSSAWLPRHRATWAEAMRAETEAVADDREALGWAVGTLRAAMTERIRGLRAIAPSTHVLGLLWITIFVVSSAFNLGLVVAARLRLDHTTVLMGRWIRGFRYDRFNTLADALPTFVIVLMALCPVLFATSLVLSLRRHARAFAAFCVACALSFAIWLSQLQIPAYLEALPRMHRFRIGVCFALTAAVLAVLWPRRAPVVKQPPI